MLKSLHGSHCLGCSSGFSACPSKSSFPTPLIWSHQASQRWHPPWLSINHSVAGRLTVPHLAFHISTLTHIFVMRSHLWRIPPTAIFRYLHHTHPPRLSTSLLPTKFSLKRYLHYLGLDPVGFMELDPHLRLSYVSYPKCRYSQKTHFHDTCLD